MTLLTYLYGQTKDVFRWTDKLLSGLPDDQWLTEPKELATCINWQAGHLVLSHLFYNINSIKGPQHDLMQALPLKKYAALYAFQKGSPEELATVTVSDLKQHLAMVQERSLQIMEGLKEKDLKEAMEPMPFRSPVAKTKGEALSWNIKHTMWHCGQMAMVRRVLDHPLVFKIPKPDPGAGQAV